MLILLVFFILLFFADDNHIDLVLILRNVCKFERYFKLPFELLCFRINFGKRYFISTFYIYKIELVFFWLLRIIFYQTTICNLAIKRSLCRHISMIWQCKAKLSFICFGHFNHLDHITL